MRLKANKCVVAWISAPGIPAQEYVLGRTMYKLVLGRPFESYIAIMQN